MTPLAQLGPYSLLSRYTEPGIAAGFIARYLPFADGNRSVSIRFPDRTAAEAERLDAELTEALKLASRLNHINVAQVFDLGRLEGRLYVVSEFIDGLGLTTMVDHAVTGGRALPHDVSAFIVSELCAGLSYAHARRDERGQALGIVHTDLSPNTVTISRAGQVKVAEFGVTWARRKAGLTAADPDARFTAPEVFAGQWDARADIYSAGAIGWTLLSGRLPFAEAEGSALQGAIVSGRLAHLRDLDPSIPGELADAIMQAVEPEPEKRFSSATDLRTALSAWLRTGAPGFGGHRLKAWLQKELTAAFSATQLDASFTPLHRKDFLPCDANSILADPGEIQSGFESVPTLASLLTVSSPAPAPRAAKPATRPAPGSAPKPSSLPVAPTAKSEDVFASRSFTDEESDAAPDARDTVDVAPAAVSVRSSDTPAAAAAKGSGINPDGPEGNRVNVEKATPSQAPALSAAAAAALRETDDDEYAGVVDQIEDVLNDVTRSVASDDSAPLVVTRQRGQGGAGPWILLVLIAASCVGGWWAYNRYVLSSGIVEPEPTVASVFVTSRPQGAEIMVDGEPTGRMTPAPIPEVQPGSSVSVSVRLAGYEESPAQSVEATARPQASLRFDLQPASHTVRVDSEPAGATVMYNGEAVGLTPYTLGPVRVDYRDGLDVTLRMDGYLDDRVAIDWSAGETESSVRRSLQPNPNWVPPAADAAVP
jgi:serine/threonine protein kinase